MVAAGPFAGLRRHLPHAGVRASLTGTGGGEPGQVVSPAGSVPGLLGGWQLAVLKVDTGAGAVGGEPDLDNAGAGRQPFRAGVAPADDEPTRRLEAKETAADRRSLDVDGELPTWLRFEKGVLPHPPHDGVGLGEVFPDSFGRGVNVHGGGD